MDKYINGSKDSKIMVDILIELEDGNLVSGSDNIIKIWNRKGEVLKVLNYHKELIEWIVQLKNGNLVSISRNERILWNYTIN